MATTPQQEPTLEPTLDDLRNPGGGNTTELDRSEESSTSALYRAAIGPMGAGFYLPIFNRFEAADRGGISWNWAASLATLNWLAFRKLWSAALAYAGTGVGLALLIFGIGRLVFRFSETVEMALLLAYLAVMFIVPGLFANALLHADSRKRMARALAANTTLPEACTMLARQAPSRNRLIALAVANALLLAAVVGAYLNFPAAGSLPKDTMSSLATMDPLGTRVAPPAAAASSAAVTTTAPTAPTSAPASTPVSVPASAPTSSTAPAALASAPATPASAAKPIAPASAIATTSVSAPAASAPKPTASAAVTATVAVATPAAKGASAATSRVSTGTVQTEPVRKASAPARAAPPVQPAASGPQETGKVYRSEPTPVAVAAPAPVSAKAAAPVAGKPESAPAVAKPPKTAAAAKTENSHLVNVGLFAQEANASNAMAKLKEANLPAYTEEVRSPTKGKLTRVRVGPFNSQADAEAAAVKIRALGLDALLVRP